MVFIRKHIHMYYTLLSCEEAIFWFRLNPTCMQGFAKNPNTWTQPDNCSTLSYLRATIAQDIAWSPKGSIAHEGSTVSTNGMRPPNTAAVNWICHKLSLKPRTTQEYARTQNIYDQKEPMCNTEVCAARFNHALCMLYVCSSLHVHSVQNNEYPLVSSMFFLPARN